MGTNPWLESLKLFIALKTRPQSWSPEAALAKRREMIEAVDAQGLIATPANSYINELVVEAARASILADAAPVRIVYGSQPHIERRSS